ncbi:MAG: ribonuclease H family protein [Lachnospiraceae bacterium]|nr:ribonuclease H family protein [Lachnospiraceae bacterium]
MSNKYYAVKVGKNPGIYMTWDECKEQVNKYPKAEFKSFTTMEEAHAFMENKIVEVEIDSKDTAVAYVDGSFNVDTMVYGYGVVMMYHGREEYYKGSGNEENMSAMRNVAGEILGATYAMKYAYDHDIKNLVIYHDYEGIAKWCLGEWKTNKLETQTYKNKYQEYSKKVNISFVKVKGHSGDKYNDLADALAKEAAGVE